MLACFFNQVNEAYSVERIRVVDSKKSFASGSGHEHSRAQIFFSLFDTTILMLHKLSFCGANVVIHSRLRDKFDHRISLSKV